MITLTIDDVAHGVEGKSLHASESIHAPWRVRVETKEHASIDPEKAIGAKAKAEIVVGDHTRAFHGVVRKVATTYEGFEVTIEPRIALLGDTVDHQLFLGKDAVEIAQAILAEHHVDVKSDVTRTLRKQDQVVQAFESDLDFVRRVLADEGIFFYVREVDDKDEVVLCDDPGAYPDAKAPHLPYRDDAGMSHEIDCVHALRLRRRVATDKVALRDYDFQHPSLNQDADAGDGKRGIERYEYPGGYVEKNTGKTMAKIRLDEARARVLTLEGEATSLALEVGCVITIEGAPRDDLDGKWLVVELQHEVKPLEEQAHDFRASFVATPAKDPYRPRRLPLPRLGGVQTATVTGSSGSEISTDKHGRMTMSFRHDRKSTGDDKASHWLRPIQPALAGGVMLPRVGWEVVVGFAHSGGDVPLQIGRLYNGTARPPEGLPGAKTSSAIGTLTTPGGGSSNLLRFVDTAGAELMEIIASKDLLATIGHSMQTFVGGNETVKIGAEWVSSIAKICAKKITGALTTVISGTHTISTATNMDIHTPVEITAIGGMRIFWIGGDYTIKTVLMARIVKGWKAVAAIEKQIESVLGLSYKKFGGWDQLTTTAAVGVKGLYSETVAGAKTISAKGYSLGGRGIKETYARKSISAGGDAAESFKKRVKVKASSVTQSTPKVEVTGETSITLEAGGAKIVIEKGSITVEANVVAKKFFMCGKLKIVG